METKLNRKGECPQQARTGKSASEGWCATIGLCCAAKLGKWSRLDSQKAAHELGREAL